MNRNLQDIVTQEELDALLKGHKDISRPEELEAILIHNSSLLVDGVSDNDVSFSGSKSKSTSEDNLEKHLTQREVDEIICGDSVEEQIGKELLDILNSEDKDDDYTVSLLDAMYDSSSLNEEDILLLSLFLQKSYDISLDSKIVRQYIYFIFLEYTGIHVPRKQIKKMYGLKISRDELISKLEKCILLDIEYKKENVISLKRDINREEKKIDALLKKLKLVKDLY